jgi:CheY-like chemotaxis protein
MRILVIEDKQIHRESAQATLTDHEVTIAESYDEGMQHLLPKIDRGARDTLLEDSGYVENIELSLNYQEARELGGDQRIAAARDRCKAADVPRDSELGDGLTFDRAQRVANARSVTPLAFEAVLVDMMMPMSEATLAPDVWVPDEQVPYGFILVLKAALRGARFVAMVTDTNHHEGAMSAALDHLGPGYYPDNDDQPPFAPNFVINGAKVMFVHAPFCRDDDGEFLGESTDGRQSRIKDWGIILADLQTEGVDGEEDRAGRTRTAAGDYVKYLFSGNMYA